ncbi:hypothetical protein LX16_4067 [Stackebrandtia albiflava]|uniref:Uncharacterized protein n=1 Tax=Stackebrandtia albiflava TaxID=406432 RepID=A0A562UYG7_9ACTN|nr:hypothetical protein [Stackebrandtia albiflava]TWJ10647.1 hypothetical protein LX16_4067 [Stackebrandtia albiflava]
MRRTAVGVGVVMALLATGTTAAHDPDGQPPPDNGSPTDTIPLVTGDRLAPRPEGGYTVIAADGARPGGYLSYSGPDGAPLLVPAEAAEDVAVGRLDHRLFDPAWLAGHGYAGATELPLRIEDASGTRREDVPVDDAEEFWNDWTETADASPDARLLLDDAVAEVEPLSATEDEGTEVTVHFAPPEGQPFDSAQINLQHVETGETWYIRGGTEGVGTGALPQGEYYGIALIESVLDGGGTGFALVFQRLKVGAEPVTVDVGGDRLQQLTFDTGRRGVELRAMELRLQMNYAVSGSSMSFTVIQSGPHRYYTTPTDEKVVDFAARPLLTDAFDAEGLTDVQYNLAFWQESGIPEDLDFVTKDSQLARRTVEYAHTGVPGLVLREDYARLTPTNNSAYVVPQVPVALPSTRTEFFTADPAVEWHRGAQVYGTSDPDRTSRYTGSLRPGRGTETWGGGPLGPALVPTVYQYALSRNEDRILGVAPLCSSPEGFEYGHATAVGEAVLYQDGQEIARDTWRPEAVSIAIPEGHREGGYTLSVSVHKQQPWAGLECRSQAEWTFESATTSDYVPLDLSVVRLDATGVRNGEARAGVPQLVTLNVERQGDQARTRSLGFEVSYDDGATWQRVPVVRLGETGLAAIWPPRGADNVSTRITATDDAGNSVTQTVVDSYRLR